MLYSFKCLIFKGYKFKKKCVILYSIPIIIFKLYINFTLVYKMFFFVINFNTETFGHGIYIYTQEQIIKVLKFIFITCEGSIKPTYNQDTLLNTQEGKKDNCK